MEAFTTHSGTVAPLDRANVDTDAIIPKQYLKSIRRTGFGPHLFDDWRYLDAGGLDVDQSTRRENPDFILNDPRYRGASILLARRNFGCGSSREHAVWALAGDGFRAVIAPSYADIFFNNCFKNGVLPVVLKEEEVSALFENAGADTPLRLTIDLAAQSVSSEDGLSFAFEIDPYLKDNLLKGLDDIGRTLEHVGVIQEYESRRRSEKPWLFRTL
jgi:3-isopropylmalate/(R)-2-methylmalate dehydratase small subunit